MSQDLYKLNRIFSDDHCIDLDTMKKYHEGTLAPQAQHQVEKHLVDCAFCTDALEGFAQTTGSEFDAMLAAIHEAMDERMESSDSKGKIIEFIPQNAEQVDASEEATENAPDSRSGSKSRGIYRYFAIAASVMLLAFVGYRFLSPDLTPGDIAQQHFELFSGHSVRGENDEAERLYFEEKYAEAAPLFDLIDSIESKYYAANAYYMSGDYAKAAERYKEIIAKGNGFKDDSEFGLAMTLLNQEKVAESRELLETIAGNSRHHFRKKAQKALEDIKKLD